MFGRHKGAKTAFATGLVVLHWLCRATNFGQIAVGRDGAAPIHSVNATRLPCKDLEGSKDTLVVLRTGSTELEERLGIQLSTSIRCFPNYIIFSDLDETYLGERIIDALEHVDANISNHHPDFELYRRLKKDGRSSLDASELATLPDAIANMSGNIMNPGWKLDKWKFLPMLNRTLHERPSMKWYVFMEADTFLFWSTLQQYLASMDPSEPIYAGNKMFIGDTGFAHDGSGFVVSQPALQIVVKYYETHKAEIQKFTDNHWAGDCVLAKVFLDVGIPLTNAWPVFQSDYPGILPYLEIDDHSAQDKHLPKWCHPTISYHHMTPAMIMGLWQLEQDWMLNNTAGTKTLRHQDIFTTLIIPQMMHPHDDWDNMSDNEEGILASVHACRLRCIAQPDCRQYSFDRYRICRTRVHPRLGRAQSGIESGWIEDRVLELQRRMQPCENEDWLF